MTHVDLQELFRHLDSLTEAVSRLAFVLVLEAAEEYSAVFQAIEDRAAAGLSPVKLSGEEQLRENLNALVKIKQRLVASFEVSEAKEQDGDED